jgi:hypothetical protein
MAGALVLGLLEFDINNIKLEDIGGIALEQPCPHRKRQRADYNL